MKDGNWIPLDKNLVHFLPKDRPYTILEAMFSYTFDIDNSNEKGFREYARIWSWSRTKVTNFIAEIKATKKPLESQERAREKPPIRYVFTQLQDEKSHIKAREKPLESHKKATTIDPDPKPDKKTYGDKVKLTADEYNKLFEQFGEKETHDRINRLDEYICSKGVKYASHYHTILTWARKDGWKPQATAKEKYELDMLKAL